MIEKLQGFAMSRRAITRLLGVAIACVVAGSVSGTAIVIVALANGAIAPGGSQLIAVNAGPFAGAIVGLVVAALLTMAGMVAAVAAWLAALHNTSRLEDKTWFSVLLVLGLVSLGWVAMIAYVLKGPDSTSALDSRAA